MARGRPRRDGHAGADPLALDVAYGLRWPTLAGSTGLQTSDEAWPDVDLRVTTAPAPARVDRIDDAWMQWTIQDGQRTIVVDRPQARATIHGSSIPADDLVHPYLGPIATVFGRWLGRESFHAGAFDSPTGAWMLVGVSQAGKSTLLSQLHGAGHVVLSDDIAVVEAGHLLTGPRTLDLRERPASVDVRRVRDDTRWRITLPPAPTRRPLAGWVELRWGPVCALRQVSAPERLRRLATWRQWKALSSDPRAFLDLAVLPGYVLERPRDGGDVIDALPGIQPQQSSRNARR